MSKKVKCRNCANTTTFAFPLRKQLEKDPDSYEWYKAICTERICCEITMKSKRIDHEQYCKYYEEANDWHKNSIMHVNEEWNEEFKDIEQEKENRRIIEEKRNVWKQKVVSDFMKGCMR